MNEDLRDIYQEVILDHNRKPRNFKTLGGATNHANGYNPLCGDKVDVYLRLENGVVAEVAFQGSGCAISTASASMMTEAVKGKTREEAEALFQKFHEMLTTEEAGDPDSLGKLYAFAGVKEFPVRVKCATLAWHTLHAALKERAETVSTE